MGVFKKVWGDTSWGSRMEDLLGNAAHVLFMNPGTTLADFRRLLTDPGYRHQLLTRVTNDDVLSYFVDEYDHLSPSAQAAIYGSLTNKVRAFMRDTLLRRIISQPGATVDFGQIMARRQILLIRLSAKWKEATSLFGSAIVLMLFHAALSRETLSSQQQPPFALYADEFQIFATETFGGLFEQVRKYNVCHDDRASAARAALRWHARRGQGCYQHRHLYDPH